MKSIKFLAVTLFATTLAYSLITPNLTAHAVTLTGDNSQRISGDDRYLTSLEISRQGWNPGEAPTVVIATGANFPDALAATPLASSFAAPLLLSRKDSLSSDLAKELIRLGTDHVILVGGTSALSDKLELQIDGMEITTDRISGETRYETAVNIAKVLGVKDTLYVATGANFADSLSISSIAGFYEEPILLIPPNGVPKVVADFINSNTIPRALIIGGEKAISSDVEDLFDNSIRIAGLDRYETNKNFNDFALQEKLIINIDLIFIATGQNYPDALSGSALAALYASPLVLTAPVPLAYTKLQIQNYSTAESYYSILGGEKALTPNSLALLFAQ